MTVTLDSVPRRLREGPATALSGMDYPDLVRLVEEMQRQDSRIIFDSLRPMCDELWNLIDGQRSVADIAEALCMEFGFELAPELFLPLAEGLAKVGLATFDA